MMRRTTLLLALTLALGMLAAPLVAEAQQAARTPRIGMLLPGSPTTETRSPRMQAFYQSLRELGWVEGQTVVFERRYAEGQYDRLSALASELARLNVDVIVTASSPPAKAAKNATTSIPIVILDPGDPVATGLVTNLARPGGNVTGVSSIAPVLAAKRLEMLKETAPKTTRVAVLFNAAIPPPEIAMSELRAAAQTLGLRIQPVEVQGSKGLEEAFGTIIQDRADGLIVLPDPLTFNNQELIANFAAKSRISSLFGAKEFVEIGGLMSYGPSYPGMFRRGAYYVDRILKGARPADLPVELPTKFELVINLKAAKALGLTIPPSVLARADQVIE